MGSVGTELASRGAPDPQEAGWGLSWPPGAPLPPRSWVGTDDQPTCSDRCLGPPNPLTTTELAGSASRCRDPVLGCMSPRSYPTLTLSPDSGHTALPLLAGSAADRARIQQTPGHRVGKVWVTRPDRQAPPCSLKKELQAGGTAALPAAGCPTHLTGQVPKQCLLPLAITAQLTTCCAQAGYPISSVCSLPWQH